jgi:CPA2 family monovalent cation:H+ antiporter-2
LRITPCASLIAPHAVSHETTLLATVAAALVLAFAFGFAAVRLRVPPIVGYLLAGVAIGPFTPGFVADPSIAAQLAEIGVLLLMFGVGLHFSPRDLVQARSAALPGAVLQMLVAAALGAWVARLWGWSGAGAVVFGLSLSVASTVVVLRVLEPRGILDTPDGRLAVGWLLVEDLAMVIALVLIPALNTAAPIAGSGDVGPGSRIGATLAWTSAKLIGFVALMFVAGRRFVPALLIAVAREGSRELFLLGVLAAALGIALGAAQLFGVSLALGAFLAGIVVGESDVSHQAAADALPLRDAFAVLFFVSVGMLVDPRVFVGELPRIGVLLLVILVGQGLAAGALALAFGRPLRTALTLATALAQIGEFSFILAALGVALGVLPTAARDLILATALVSITLNPLLVASVGPLERFVEARPRLRSALERSSVARRVPVTIEREAEAIPSGHVIIVGYGRVGTTIGEILRGEDIPFIVVERDRQTVERARDAGVTIIFGDGVSPGMLRHAHAHRARLLVVTVPEPLRARAIIAEARRDNPAIDIVVRAHSETDQLAFRALGVGRVVLGERELAFGMARYALQAIRSPSRT